MPVIYAQITTRCNMRCGHCCMAATESGEDMSVETFDTVLRIVEEQEGYLCIGGGEPTVHPDFELLLMRAIAACDAEGGVHVITNGKETRRALLLAKLAKSGVIGAELSIDPWHEDVEPEVYEAFGAEARRRPSPGDRRIVSSDRDRRGTRTVAVQRLIQSGRSRTGERRCCCDGPFVKPNGDVAQCGCKGSPVLGNVSDPGFSVFEHDEVFEFCGRWTSGGRRRKAHPEFTRAGGGAECPECGRPYYDHPGHPEHPWLTVACDGRLLKL